MQLHRSHKSAVSFCHEQHHPSLGETGPPRSRAFGSEWSVEAERCALVDTGHEELGERIPFPR